MLKTNSVPYYLRGKPRCSMCINSTLQKQKLLDGVIPYDREYYCIKKARLVSEHGSPCKEYYESFFHKLSPEPRTPYLSIIVPAEQYRRDHDLE